MDDNRRREASLMTSAITGTCMVTWYQGSWKKKGRNMGEKGKGKGQRKPG